MLPASESKARLEEAVQSAMDHWDQFNPGIQKLHVLGWMTFVSELEDSSGVDIAIARDAALQASKGKPRRPKVDAWIQRQLEADASAKSPDLWKRAPGWITDDLVFGSFAKRVTKIRKRSM